MTIATDAASYLMSALVIGSIKEREEPPKTPRETRRFSDLLVGWRYILSHRQLRRLFFNSVVVNGLIMAGAPLMAVLMLGTLGFASWQYGLAFGLPCVGGVIGSRIARPLISRLRQYRTIRIIGTLRVIWPVGLAFVQPGLSGLLLVMIVQFCLVTVCGAFIPISTTLRLEQIEPDRIARTLAAWSVSGNLTTALLTVLWGLLAS